MSGTRRPKSLAKKGMTYTRLLVAESISATVILDALAQIIVPVDSVLIGVQGTIYTFGAADDDEVRFEVSTSGNYQGDDNDNTDTLFVLMSLLDFLTSGKANMAQSGSISGIKIPFAAGERIFANAFHAASVQIRGVFVLHFQAT